MQVPAALKLRSVLVLMQVAAGGELHASVCVGYVQVPPPQVPGLPKVWRVVEFTQVAAGGVVQVTPMQGSALHMPPVQPFAQTVSVGA